MKKANELSEFDSTTKRTNARSNLDVLWSDDIRSILSRRAPLGGLHSSVVGGSSAVSGTTGVNIGLGSFSVALLVTLADFTPGSNAVLFQSHSTGNNRIRVLLLTTGAIQLVYVDNGGVSANYVLTPDVAFVDGGTYLICITDDRSVATLLVNGVSDRDKSGGGVTVSTAASAAVDIGSGNANVCGYFALIQGTISFGPIFNRALSASEALALAQTGRVAFSDQWGSFTVLNSGTFTVGKRYRIVSRTDGDFTTVGSANNSVGTEFIATATGAGILDAGDTVVQIGAVADLDFHHADPGQSLSVRDRSTNLNHGTSLAADVNQVARVPQMNPVRLSVGSASVLTKLITATAALDFGSIAAAASADLTIAVTGAAVNDSVSLGEPADPTAGIIFRAFVSATNTVTVRATNITAGAIDPASQTFRVTVFNF